MTYGGTSVQASVPRRRVVVPLAVASAPAAPRDGWPLGHPSEPAGGAGQRPRPLPGPLRSRPAPSPHTGKRQASPRWHRKQRAYRARARKAARAGRVTPAQLAVLRAHHPFPHTQMPRQAWKGANKMAARSSSNAPLPFWTCRTTQCKADNWAEITNAVTADAQRRVSDRGVKAAKPAPTPRRRRSRRMP